MGCPEAMRIAANRANGLFRNTHWDEFVATAEMDGSYHWTVRIEPKSGDRDDRIWLRLEGGEIASFGFHRKDKLKGYTGKSKLGAEPGFCK
jgi:hypothetical protein